jgi:hypothetical protein
VRGVFASSALNNMRAAIPPSSPILASVLSEKMKQATSRLRCRSSEVRDDLNLSASDSLFASSIPILLSISSENEMRQQGLYSRDRGK